MDSFWMLLGCILSLCCGCCLDAFLVLFGFCIQTASTFVDENGNLLVDTEIKDNIHTMMLNHSHKPSKHVTEEERILKIKEGLTKLRENIIANIEANIHDQCGENTFYYCWSVLDLSEKIPTDTRIERLRNVITLLCTFKVHTVGKYNVRKESEIVPEL